MISTEELSNRLEKCYTGAVYDVLRNRGYKNQLLPYTIRPLNLQHKIAGPIFAIEGKADASLDRDTSLLKWCGMLSNAPSGYVVVCSANDNTVAHMGELSAETFTYKNVKGYITDGGCRDSAFIDKIGFPVYCSYYTPKDVVSAWQPVAMGGTITMGGVNIITGDYILADRDGIIIIPKGIAVEVTLETEAMLQTENQVRKAILAGVDPVDAYKSFGKF